VNGIHDMGGMHGFGPVRIEPDEPVFHRRWEARVFGISLLSALRLGGNIDARRHGLERLDPVTYLKDGYYGRWLARLETDLLGLGVLARDELEARAAGGKAPAAALPALPAAPPRPAHPFLRAVPRQPAFRLGDRVRTRNHQPPGHTRLTAYARGRRGAVARVHPACVFPDTHAHFLGENPEHVYAVRFEAHELWGEGAEAGTCVHLDCFESYLEPDPET
jgi:nitrile hydratase subunit beta